MNGRREDIKSKDSFKAFLPPSPRICRNKTQLEVLNKKGFLRKSFSLYIFKKGNKKKTAQGEGRRILKTKATTLAHKSLIIANWKGGKKQLGAIKDKLSPKTWKAKWSKISWSGGSHGKKPRVFGVFSPSKLSKTLLQTRGTVLGFNRAPCQISPIKENIFIS